jgi:glucosamine-6-phosphate deaminase
VDNTDAGLIRTFRADELEAKVFRTLDEMALAAARAAVAHLRVTLEAQERAAVIFATGNSQLRFLEHLAVQSGVDWSRITLFHMDEYLGIAPDHPASFRRYLRERVESKLKPRVFHYLQGEALEPLKECERYTRLLHSQMIDLCCLGIGENGHLAFNDPPVADFHDPLSVKLVKLDEACRRQQVGEGHFPGIDAVPQYAFTLTIPALCSSGKMLCIAPEQRKAQAVCDALRGPITPRCPASFLRRQSHAVLFLDMDSAGRL